MANVLHEPHSGWDCKLEWNASHSGYDDEDWYWDDDE